MDANELSQSGCPWYQPLKVAAYAAEAVVDLISVPQRKFASAGVRRFAHAHGGFVFQPTVHFASENASDANRFLGAVLAKVSQRGLPAPCSLALERHLLQEAAQANILDFEESGTSGEWGFACHPRLPHLRTLLKACLLPELLVRDRDVDALLSSYRSLCSEREQRFFSQLIALLPEERLALCCFPQRPFASMVELQPGSPFVGSRVDISIEIPHFNEEKWLRRVIEVDDRTHDEDAQKNLDAQRDQFLKSGGWATDRFRHEGGRWVPKKRESELPRLAELLRAAIPQEYSQAAKELLALPHEQQRAIQNLVLLPISEAKLTTALAHLCYQGCNAEITVGDPQGLGLGPAVDAANAMMEALRSLHGIRQTPRLAFAPLTTPTPDLIYFGIPSHKAWEALSAAYPGTIVLAPQPVSVACLEPFLSAQPRPVEFSSDRSEVVSASLSYLLHNVFRKREFRAGQLEIIKRALALKPVIGLLPTGAGKSLCYQLASLAQPGCTLIVDPLRALMQDQKDKGSLRKHSHGVVQRGTAIRRKHAARSECDRRHPEGGPRTQRPPPQTG